ncbi:MAG: DUF262 domain-containing protein [Gammaproteobacteria bacterium]|nr:DUF262 domain-containing protein [Gammaproteobacteria bacterium]
MTKKLKKIEEQSYQENDSPEIPPPDVIAYNELRSCADLYRMHNQGILNIRPEFQREIVWKNSDQTRFIDSLVKQLPIPSMCFSLDYKTQKWQVIDGLQRMSTIVRFLSGETWIFSKLEDIDPKLSGEYVSKFVDENSDLHDYYKRVENLTLPITVLRCDYSNTTHTHYLFTIFHRLNTGGMKLNNQEIRNCIYAGELNKLLKELNSNPSWMKLNKMKKDIGFRFTKQELILRIFAFHDRYKEYKGRLARFLNDYMSSKKDPDEKFIEEKRELFNHTIDLMLKKIFDGKVPEKLTLTVLETALVGISHNIKYLESQPASKVKELYKKLLSDDELSESKLIEGLSGKARVIGRLNVAINIFSGK